MELLMGNSPAGSSAYTPSGLYIHVLLPAHSQVDSQAALFCLQLCTEGAGRRGRDFLGRACV